jgi:hypothetical protein
VPLIDLVTPWAHAAASLDAREVRSFRGRHAVVLESIRRQRAPLLGELPAPKEWHGAALRAADGDLLDALRSTRDRLVSEGFRVPGQIVLAACGAPGPVAEVMPGGSSTVVLFLDRDPIGGAQRAAPRQGRPQVRAALAAANALLHPWTE